MSVKDHPITGPRQPSNATTPRPPNPQTPCPNHSEDTSNLRTPTRDTFAGLAGQRPLPSPSSLGRKEEIAPLDGELSRSASTHSTHPSESEDIKMGDGDEDDQSDDDDSNTSDPTRSKKKKSQRFFCTDFPPCQLSFTRSEHLARHIRKHTGERPFQCHCLRRFSRLDNLRQHAQTVHLNEDIPGDSLAATSTRFQRQIRTDRMRPPNPRARGSSQSIHTRGHSRNWSGSSMGSVSDIASPDDRRRPQPLAMAQLTPSRGALTLDTYGATVGSPEGYQSYFNDSPTAYSTPTSVFSATTGSPMGPSGLHSPVAMMSRNYSWGERQHHGRRLSVPSAQGPYQPSYSSSGVQYMTPLASSTASTYSQNGSGYASPTSSVFSSDLRRESISGDADIRRRTWHPGTHGAYGARPPTSGLSYYQTPDTAQPVAASQPPASQTVRLPGIDSFDNVRAQPIAPLRRPPSPTESDVQKSQDNLARDHTRDSWSSISQGMTRLEVAQPSQYPVARRADALNPQQPPLVPILSQPNTSMHVSHKSAPAQINVRFEDGHRVSTDPATERKKKRHAWYNGPLQSTHEAGSGCAAVRTSPDGSNSSSEGIPTPSVTYAAQYHPAIVHSNGYVEAPSSGMEIDEASKPPQNELPRTNYTVAQYPPQHANIHIPRTGGEMNRLDALVAVATSDAQAVARR